MTERFTSLWDIFEKSTQEYAHRPLFGTKVGGAWRWITYDEFRKDVERFRGRARLARASAQGDRVAIVAPNRVEWAIAAYATYGLGAAFVPMYEAQRAGGVGASSCTTRARRSSSAARAPCTTTSSSLKAQPPDARARARHLPVGRGRELVPSHLVRGGTAPVGPIAAEPARTSPRTSTRRAPPATRRASSSRTRTSARTSTPSRDCFRFDRRRSLALVPAVGARVRADVRAPHCS